MAGQEEETKDTNRLSPLPSFFLSFVPTGARKRKREREEGITSATRQPNFKGKKYESWRVTWRMFLHLPFPLSFFSFHKEKREGEGEADSRLKLSSKVSASVRLSFFLFSSSQSLIAAAIKIRDGRREVIADTIDRAGKRLLDCHVSYYPQRT